MRRFSSISNVFKALDVPDLPKAQKSALDVPDLPKAQKSALDVPDLSKAWDKMNKAAMLMGCFCFGDFLSKKLGGLVKSKRIVFVERKVDDLKTLAQENHQALTSDINQGFAELKTEFDDNVADLKASQEEENQALKSHVNQGFDQLKKKMEATTADLKASQNTFLAQLKKKDNQGKKQKSWG